MQDAGSRYLAAFRECDVGLCTTNALTCVSVFVSIFPTPRTDRRFLRRDLDILGQQTNKFLFFCVICAVIYK